MVREGSATTIMPSWVDICAMLCGLESRIQRIRSGRTTQSPQLLVRAPWRVGGPGEPRPMIVSSPQIASTMPTLATVVDGLKLPNPFVIGSGPPGTNMSVINRAFREGWGAVIAKTVSLDASKVINVTPRYAKHLSLSGEVIGWENIELISDRPFKIWEDEFKKIK